MKLSVAHGEPNGTGRGEVEAWPSFLVVKSTLVNGRPNCPLQTSWSVYEHANVQIGLEARLGGPASSASVLA